MAAKNGSNVHAKGGSRKSAKAEHHRHNPRETQHGNYDVGFGKPPTRTQFKPGVSGNPKGRPKWKDKGMLSDMIGRELYRSVRVSQNGETISIPALQVALRRLVRMGAEGNPKSVETMLKIAIDHGRTVADDEHSTVSQMTEQERVDRITELFERARRRKLAHDERLRLKKSKVTGKQ